MYIQHALSVEGEHKVPNPDGQGRPYRVDGYIASDNCILEFNGCLWHGCVQCYPYNSPDWTADSLKEPYPLHPHTGQTMKELYQLTLARQRYLSETLGYKVVTMWECQFLRLIETDQAVRSFVDAVDVRERLDPRNGLFGGRTNACHLYRSVGDSDSERIGYADITSLYPSLKI